MNEPSFDFIKTDIFNFLVCKIYLGTRARRARRHVVQVKHVGCVGHVVHLGHVGTLGTPLSRLHHVNKNLHNYNPDIPHYPIISSEETYTGG